jgi:hypothetical protein
MISQKHVKRMVVATFAVLACSLVLSGWIAHIAAANPGKSLGTKMVYIDAQYRVDPVTITAVTVGDQQIQPGLSTGAMEVQPGTPFQAGEDWLKSMSISLKNRTDKVIVRAELQLWFPDTGDGSPSQPVTTYIVTLGQRPEIDSYTSRGQKLPPEPANKQPLLHTPGQTLVIHLADYIEAIKLRVEEKIAWSQVSRLAVQRIRVYFVDGTRWNDQNGYGIPDPNHPGQFTNMDRNKYFPGNRSQDWPPPTQQAEPGRHRSE